MNKNILSAAALAVLMSGSAAAQSTLNAAGGSATIGGNTYEYSIGEMTMVSTNTAGSITVTHGVLQPAKNGTGIAAQPWLSAGLSIYPNPASEEVFIKPSLPAASLLSYSLTDAAGRLVLAPAGATLHTGTEQQRIDLSAIAAGTYLLVIEAAQPNGQQARQAFKINKVR